MENQKADYEVFNVGTGLSTSIKQIAETLASLYKINVKPQIENKFRSGDIRHCFADISKIKGIGFKPEIDFNTGMKDLVEWGITEEAKDLTDIAIKELKEKGLVKGM